MKSVAIILLYVFSFAQVLGQGKTHHFLMGYTTALDSFTTSPKGRLLIDSNSVTVLGETRKMAFGATQGNISDENGNLIISSNGCWIADATGDTMIGGGGLNPNSFTTDYCDSLNGLPLSHGNLILPYPNDSNKYILFHQTANYNANITSTELFYSEIDISLNGGLGIVINKNQVILNDTLGWGISATKHANGRDWWIVVLANNETYFQIFLLSPAGISSPTKQTLQNTAPNSPFAGQPLFSPNGEKFAFTTSYSLSTNAWYHDVRVYDFDRCNGTFSNQQIINLTDSFPALGTAFSSNSKMLYSPSFLNIFQLNLDSANLASSVQTVAVYDGFYSPVFPFATRFWLPYLAPNGKIYISPGTGVVDLHVINSPDSSGLACDVQQHSLHLPYYSFRSNVNHPNYYLGCDTTSGCPCLVTSINELQAHDFKLSVSPNPTNGNIKIMYLLPQNRKGVFEVFDVAGKKVFAYNLPSWSTLQNFDLRFLEGGVYSCVITSGNESVSRKLVLLK